MKLQKIHLENFASYFGKIPLDLETSSEKPIVIFIGGTGFGKTSLFDAINWALYGEEYEKDLHENKGRDILDYVNESALKEAQSTNENVTMRVTLYFEHNNKQYYITQTLLVKPKKKDGIFVIEKKDQLTQLKEILPSGDHESISYNKIFLDEILPNNVKSYFLFDGDRIHNLAKPGNSTEVQEAIYRVVDLEIVRNAGEHLGDISIDYSKKAAKAAKGKLAEIENQYQEELAEQKKIKKKINTIKSERKAIKNQLNKLDEKLKDREETTKFQGRREHLISEMDRINKEKKELKTKMRDTSAIATLGLANSEIKELKDLLEKKRKKGEIPKHVQETFFQDLYDIKECICGTKFKTEEGDLIYDQLQKRSQIEQKRSKEDEGLLNLSYELKEVTKNIENAKKLLDEIEDQLLDQDRELEKLVLEKQEVDNALDELPQEDINQLINQRKQRESKNEELFSDLSTQEGILENLKKRLSDLDKQRKEIGKKQKESHAFQLRSELSKTAGETIDALYEEFAEESRAEVEKLTIEEFQKFVTSSSGYKVGLSKDYELEVLDSNGNRALQRLSMGQSQCLSLAFITAISRVSEKHPPLVIDMPFSRLDPSVHESVSKRLPKISQQTILFLIPKIEWNDKTEVNLRNYANHIYQMDFDENNRQTLIEPIS